MKKGLETWLYSTLGVAAMGLLLVVGNALLARAKVRVDLTADRAHTLSDGTRAILARLDTPVQIRFYCTRNDSSMPVPLRTYAQRVEDLLEEYRQASKGLVEIQKLDPVPDSDAEDSARLDGIESQPRLDGEPITLGLSVSLLDQKEAIPFLSPERERLLEYDLSRAISRVMAATKPVIGILSPLPVSGRPASPMLMQMGQRSQPAWVLHSELKRDFELRTIEPQAESIPDDVKVLVLIHPKDLPDPTLYAIDQFLLRGGKLVAFLDPQSVLDPAAGGMMGMGGGSSSNLGKLLAAWGLSFDSARVVADLDYLGRTRQGRQPAVLALTETAANRDDITTAEADNLFLVFAGAFSGSPATGLQQTVLLQSSANSQLVDAMSAQFDGERVIRSFVRSDTRHPLALRLTGKFKTAFPDGKPKPATPDPANPPAEDKKEESAAESLKESKTESAVVLIGDADFIQDPIAVQEAMDPFGAGQRIVFPANGNLAFAQAVIEQLAGDDALIGVRGRATRERQFTVVKELQAKAESAYQSKIEELENSLQEAQTKLNELQRAKSDQGGQKFILSPEQQQEIANFRKKESEVKQQLKQERKKLRAEIDALENRVKWLNIALVPALVTATGAGLALVRHRRRAAR